MNKFLLFVLFFALAITATIGIDWVIMKLANWLLWSFHVNFQFNLWQVVGLFLLLGLARAMLVPSKAKDA